jgi:hypothetical protein
VNGQPGVTHVLLDFFGTLVNYSPSRTGQGYHDSHDLTRAMGADISYAGFLQAWTAESASFDARSASDDSEFSMTELACAFLAGLLGRAPDPAGITAFVSCYLREWNSGVTYPQGMAGVVADLAQHCRLAIVTNTHQPDLVPLTWIRWASRITSTRLSPRSKSAGANPTRLSMPRPSAGSASQRWPPSSPVTPIPRTTWARPLRA